MFDPDLLPSLLPRPLLPMITPLDLETLTPLFPTLLNSDQSNQHPLLESPLA